jgi:hypothetical protein
MRCLTGWLQLTLVGHSKIGTSATADSAAARTIPLSCRACAGRYGCREFNTAASQTQAVTSSHSLKMPSEVVIQVRTMTSCFTVSIQASPDTASSTLLHILDGLVQVEACGNIAARIGVAS